MRVLVLSRSVARDGRARALLSLAEYLSQPFDVRVVTGTTGLDETALRLHHGFWPDCEWRPVEWTDRDLEVRRHVEDFDPDVVISWDGQLNATLQQFDRPTIGYLRTKPSFHADEFWAPSKTVAERFDKICRVRGAESRVRPIYPVWYIEPRVDRGEGRPFDVMVHGRKFRESLTPSLNQYNVVLANRFTYSELRKMFLRTKAFVFPKPPRFEPLGLMPIEAAACGCAIGVPDDSGVAELFPDESYEDPAEHIDTILDRQPPTDPIPESPTDPVERINRLTE